MRLKYYFISCRRHTTLLVQKIIKKEFVERTENLFLDFVCLFYLKHICLAKGALVPSTTQFSKTDKGAKEMEIVFKALQLETRPIGNRKSYQLFHFGP